MAGMSVRNIQPGSGRWWCVETRRRKWVIIQQFLFQSIRCHRINIVYFDIKLNMRVRMAFAWNICISMLFIDNDWLSNDKDKIITEYPLNFWFWHLMFDVLSATNQILLFAISLLYFYDVDINYCKIIILSDPVFSLGLALSHIIPPSCLGS